jgi:hypothetical protein
MDSEARNPARQARQVGTDHRGELQEGIEHRQSLAIIEQAMRLLVAAAEGGATGRHADDGDDETATGRKGHRTFGAQGHDGAGIQRWD